VIGKFRHGVSSGTLDFPISRVQQREAFGNLRSDIGMEVNCGRVVAKELHQPSCDGEIYTPSVLSQPSIRNRRRKVSMREVHGVWS
jgi:hypothetical protein